MQKILRRTWFIPPLALVGLTTWAFAALNHPAPMEGWPPAPSEVAEAPAAAKPVERARPRRSLLALARRPPVAQEASAPDLVGVLAPDGERPVAFVEVAALWRAPVGRAFERCLAGQSGRERFEITTLASTVERFATDGRVIVLEGELGSDAHHEIFFDDLTAESYGDGAQLYGRRGARVSDRLVVMRGGHAGDFRGAVDRAEGRRATSASALPDSERYGEVSMVLPPRIIREALEDLAGAAPEELEAIERATLHVDALDEVIVTVEIFASDTHALAGIRDSVELVARAYRTGRPLFATRGPQVEDVQVEQAGERLSVMIRATAEEAVRVVPECRDRSR